MINIMKTSGLVLSHEDASNANEASIQTQFIWQEIKKGLEQQAAALQLVSQSHELAARSHVKLLHI